MIWSVAKPSTPLHDMPKELEHKIVPFVSVRDCNSYVTFLTKVFGAEEAFPASKDPSGKVRVGLVRVLHILRYSCHVMVLCFTSVLAAAAARSAATITVVPTR